jgi:CheY-like chemotaxis protein
MSKTVLIVDDSAILRKVLREFLSRHAGAETFEEAADGQEALAKVAASKPDLIILDLAMPVMDGVRATQALKQLAPDVPILLFTMYHARAEDIGVDVVISKVDGIGRLAGCVRSVLSRDVEQSKAAGT